MEGLQHTVNHPVAWTELFRFSQEEGWFRNMAFTFKSMFRVREMIRNRLLKSRYQCFNEDPKWTLAKIKFTQEGNVCAKLVMLTTILRVFRSSAKAGHVDKDFMVHSRAPHKLRNLYLNGLEGCLNQESSFFSYFPMLKYICHYFSCSFTAALVMISCWGGCSSGGWSGSPSNGKVTVLESLAPLAACPSIPEQDTEP